MGWTGRAAVGAVAVVALAAGFAAVRTLAIKPVAASAGAATPATPFDLASAAKHLGEAVRIQTVSHQNPAQNDAAQLTALHAWLATTYPHFAAATKREDVPGTAALVWTWPGSDPSLPPVILM